MKSFEYVNIVHFKIELLKDISYFTITILILSAYHIYLL